MGLLWEDILNVHTGVYVAIIGINFTVTCLNKEPKFLKFPLLHNNLHLKTLTGTLTK